MKFCTKKQYSRFQTGDGNNKYSVISAVCKRGGSCDHHQKRRFFHLVRIYFCCKLLKCFCSLIYCGVCSKLDFCQSIRSVFQMDYGIAFQVRFISVMIYLSINSLTVNAQVPDTEVFEPESE